MNAYKKITRDNLVFYIKQQNFQELKANWNLPDLELLSTRKLMLMSNYVIDTAENKIIKNRWTLEYLFDCATGIGIDDATESGH
jgi:hypothetical protein